MIHILKTVWRNDKKRFLLILLLNTLVALTGSVSIVMLVPMLDLLDISSGANSGVAILLAPFAGLSYTERAAAIIGAFVVLLLLRALLNSFATLRANEYYEGYERQLRKELYHSVSNADWEKLSETSSTDLINLLTVQCRQSKQCLQWTFGLITSIFSAILQLAIAVWMSPSVTIIVLVVGCGFLFGFRPFLLKSKRFGREAVEITREMYGEIRNQLRGIKEIRAYDVESHHSDIFNKVIDKRYDVNLRAVQLHVLPQLLYSLAAAVLIAFAFVYSVIIEQTGTAQLVILVYIFSRLWPLFSSWQSQLQNIQTNVPAYDTIREAITDLSGEKSSVEQLDGELAFAHDVSFDNVSFAYKDSNAPVLNNICFTLPYGSVTALVGPSGAGKSTTADLLLGLLRPGSGQITVDGQPLTQAKLKMWRRAMGYIPQEPLIINASIRENLLRFHPNASEEEMIDALKQSNAWPVVEKLPQGLDTVLGERGLRLSGGERQRIVLARVLMGKPKLIILDEATSALDYESESFVRETIRSLRGKTTVLIIAHRLATIRGADRAVVLEDGKVAEQGAMQELLQKEHGYLADMVSVE